MGREWFSHEAAAIDRETMAGHWGRRAPAGAPPREGDGVPHTLVQLAEKRGVAAPTYRVTARQLARHIEVYGSESTEGVVPS